MITRRRALVLAVLVLLLLVAALVVGIGRWWSAPVPPRADAEAADALAATLDRVLQRSAQPMPPGLAIRTLVTAADDPQAAGLAGPVCDSMVNRLARLPGLRVASCGSTGAEIAADLDDRALSRLLAVDYLVKGRLQSLPRDRLRVQLVLHDMRGDRERWRIDEEMAASDLQGLPMRVAREAAPALGQPASAATEPMIAAEAYARFLRATQLFRRPALEERREALRLVDEVLAVEPDHAPSLYLRMALRSRLDGFETGGPADQGSAAQAAAAQAALISETHKLGERLLALDPGDRRGNILLLNAAIDGRRWDEAFRRGDALLQHAQQQPGVLRIVARLYLMAGYVQRAQALAFEAARLDALDAESIEYLATTHGMRRRDPVMRELLTVARQIGHGSLDLFDAVLAHRRADWPDFERAMTAYATNTQRPADWVPAYARGVADARERERAAQLLDAHDPSTRHYMSDYFFEYALLGDVPRSLQAIRHHARQPPRLWLEYLWWPELAAVRQQAGFAEAVSELGLTRLWQERGAPDLCQPGTDGHWACR